MKLLFKERFFTWFDSYDIYDEFGRTAYTVEGKLAWGHKLEIHDSSGVCVGTVNEEIFTLLPRFSMYVGDQYVGCIKKELTFLKPRFNLDFNGWQVQGDFWEWEYDVICGQEHIMHASKELLKLTDTYVIDVDKPENALYALMIVLAIDAAKCSS